MRANRRHVSALATKRVTGFTLLELLIVVAILSSIAYVALDTLKEDVSQIRFDDTENRLVSIRKAIVGDHSRRLGQGSEISGYVADVGVLPSRLRDLIEDPCQNPVAGNCGWKSDGALRFGWRGPYLNVTSVGGDNSFRDGWGNTAISTVEDDDNFGWIYSFCRTDEPPDEADLISCSDGATSVEESSQKLEVVSAGRDALNDGLGIGYDAETTLPIHLSDYAVDDLVLQLAVTNNSGGDLTNLNLCARLSVPQLNNNGTPTDSTDDFYELVNVESVISDSTTDPVTEAVLSVTAGATQIVQFDFTGSSLPWGVKGIQLFEEDGSGECDDSEQPFGDRFRFRLIPRTVPPQLSAIYE